MNLEKIIGIRATMKREFGFPCLETRSICKFQILRSIKTYMIMDNIGLKIGTMNKCCLKCKFSLDAYNDKFVRCSYHRFYPFKQFVCNNYGKR